MVLFAAAFAVLFVGLAEAETLPGIPTVPFEPSGDGILNFSSIARIIVDESKADVVNDEGLTLIPPTLLEFAETFAKDIASVWDQNVSVSVGSQGGDDAVLLTLGESNEYIDAAGRETSEGYTLETSDKGVTITGASPLGVWWGTRTLLQQVILGEGSVPAGVAVDSPGWKERGVMVSGIEE